jgi:hypothetical protein
MTILLTGAEPDMVHAALDAGESVVVFDNPAPVSIGRDGAQRSINRCAGLGSRMPRPILTTDREPLDLAAQPHGARID